MRRGAMLVLGLLATFVALPETAGARDRGFPDAIFGIISKPIGAILGTVRRIGRGPAIRPPAPIRSRSAAAHKNAASRTASQSPDAGTPAAGAARAAPTLPAAAAVGATAAVAASPADSAAIPIPAPRQRSASLSSPPPEGKVQNHVVAASPQPGREGSQAASQLGLVGPLAWPSAYEDVIGFTLWPRTYAERLRVHGLTDVLTTIFAPAATPGARIETARAAVDGAKLTDASSNGAVGGCKDSDKMSSNWPAEQIEGAFELTSGQRSALDQLKATIAEAVAAIKATCRDAAAVTPVERLQAMQNKLWAVRDAAIIIRVPLARFFESLTDDQKKQLLLPASQADPRATVAGRSVSRQALARLCGMPTMNESSLQPIERTLQPSKSQHASLELLQKKSFEMGQFLMASCLQPMPATPTARLDSAIDRLTAVLFAASTINLAFNDFYNQLSEQQKTKLEAFAR